MTAEWVWLIVPERAPTSQLQKEYLSHSTASVSRFHFHKMPAASDWPAADRRPMVIGARQPSVRPGSDGDARCAMAAGDLGRGLGRRGAEVRTNEDITGLDAVTPLHGGGVV